MVPTITNHGPLITAIDEWPTAITASFNAGTIRVLLPVDRRELLQTLRTAKTVELIVGASVELRWGEAGSMHFDTIDQIPPPGDGYIVSVWVKKGQRPHKAMERPAVWRAE